LRGLRRLRDLLEIGGADRSQRKRRNDQSSRDQRGREQHIPSVFALVVIGRHIVHPRIVREINGWQGTWFRGELGRVPVA
jgi:hypothetical protein